MGDNVSYPIIFFLMLLTVTKFPFKSWSDKQCERLITSSNIFEIPTPEQARKLEGLLMSTADIPIISQASIQGESDPDLLIVLEGKLEVTALGQSEKSFIVIYM
jgi:hypothetical protein